MKVTFAVNPECTIETEVKDVKQSFALVAHLQEIFGVKKCGNCGSPHVKLRHRTPQGYEYFSVHCEDCHHELKFGQSRETGRLFPKGWEPPYSDKGDSGQSRNGQGPQYHDQEDEPSYEQERARSTSSYNSAASSGADSIPW